MNFNVWGFIFILFGLTKILLVVLVTWILPRDIEEKLSKIPAVNLFVSGDTSLAGRMIDYIILTFAIFTLIHGLAVVDVFSPAFTHFIESKELHYTIYSTLGLICILFYSLVLYTSLPIDKNPTHKSAYRIYGYVTGISFLVAPLILEGVELLFPILQKTSVEKQLIALTTFMLLGAGGATGMYFLMSKVNKDD